MTNAAAFHQVDQFLGKILGVISSAFKRLGNKQKIGAVLAVATVAAFQMPAEHRSTGLVDPCISTQHPVGILQVAFDETPVNAFQHLLKNARHFQ